MFVTEIKMQVFSIRIFIYYKFLTKMIQEFMFEKINQAH